MSARSGLLAAALYILCAAGCVEGPRHDGSPLRCAIGIPSDPSGNDLRCGYNYEMLRRYADAEGRDISIRLAGKREQVLDSLRHGVLDIVSLPYSDKLAADTTLVWIPSDSCGVWVFSSGRSDEADFAREWLEAFAADGGHDKLKASFMNPVSPWTSDTSAYICPYDSLFRVYADTLGWDWRMLAALVYQESKFRIEARSPRGARGLMQLVPDTARNFGCTDMLDPEENIRAGVRMLGAVENRFRKTAANKAELTKFTLAAYNAGAARVQDCIRYARHTGNDVSHWDNVARAVPEMKHDSLTTASPVKLGTFNGRETIFFVRYISVFYDRYTMICP